MMSHELILALFHLLLFSFGIVIIISLILGRLIVSFPRFFLKLLGIIVEILFSPINFLITTLKFFALNHLLNWFVDKVEQRCFKESNRRLNRKSISYGRTFIFVIPVILFLVIFPGDSLLEGIIIISFVVTLFMYKVWNFNYRIKPAVQQAKLFEKAAKNAYQRGFSHDTITYFDKALDIYKMPLLLKNPKFDVNRAKLFEQMGIVLYKEGQLKKALRYFSQAISICRKADHSHDPKLMKSHVRALKVSAELLLEMGRRSEAHKRYEIIYDLTGAYPKEL